jgi:hypothetical protein
MIMEHIACEHVVGNLISAKGGDNACHPMAAWSSIGGCGCTHADSRNLTPVNILPKKPPGYGGFLTEDNRQGNFCLGGGLSGPRGDYQKGDPMRKTLIVGVTLALMCGSALAQTQAPPAQQGPGNRAVNTEGTNNSSAPVAGANSFTEGQAKSRIEAGGYSNVTELKKDDSGVWRGKGMKDGKSVTVSVDFQGNVIAR